jgi:hypothetical protein
MNQETSPYPYESEFSLGMLLNDRLVDIKHILSFKKSLIFVLIVGCLLGAFAAWLKKPTYTARLTFVIDDSKSGSSSGLSALAGQFGFNLDGLGQKLIKATLLSAYDSSQTLADRYADVYHLNNSWIKYSTDGKTIRFPLNGKHNTRIQDSLLHEMTKLILSGEFGISKVDKKLSFFEVSATMKDEKLALLFCNRMINQATDFFIFTKTKRIRSNVERLQHRADSIGAILNRKTYTLSSANQSLLDLNPAYTRK